MVPSQYLNQCWFTVDWTHGNKFQWNFNQNTTLFIQENEFENVCKWEAIVFQSNSFLISDKEVLVTLWVKKFHYGDVIMGAIASQITSLTIVYSTIYSDADQRKHQSSASLAFVRGIPRGPVNSPHKEPVMRKMFPFDDVIMYSRIFSWISLCPTSMKLKAGYTVFPSSVCPSICSFVCLSICGQNHVCSLSSTILGSISYLYISSSTFRRCVTCEVFCKIPKFELKFATLTLSCLDLEWKNVCENESIVWETMGWGWGYAQNAGVLVPLVFHHFYWISCYGV